MSIIARPATTPSRDAYAFIAGQSLGLEMNDRASWRGFWYSITDNAIYTNPDKKVSATGGSSVLKRFQRVDIPNLYWYDEDTGSDGPLLTTAKAVIAAMVTAPTMLIWVQGEQDADQMTTEGDRVLYQAGLTYVIGQLKTAINGGAPNNVRTIISVLGRRDAAGDYPGWSLVRQSHLNIIAGATNVWGAEKYDIELRDSVHGTNPGYLNMGWRIGEEMSALDDTISGGSTTIASGPEIDTGNVAVVGNTIEIPITVEASHTLTKPALPTGFGFVDVDDELVEPTAWAWDGDTLVATFAASPAGLTVEYPYQNMPDYTASGVIRYSSAVGAPTILATSLDGKPLKSILPIEL